VVPLFLAHHQLRLLRQLLLSLQLRQRSRAEVAFGDLPLVVLLAQDRAHEPYHRSLVRKDPHHFGPPCLAAPGGCSTRSSASVLEGRWRRRARPPRPPPSEKKASGIGS